MKIEMTHLRQLEAESIHIIREVAVEFEWLVLLYSFGKDSAVAMLLSIRAAHRCCDLRSQRPELPPERGVLPA